MRWYLIHWWPKWRQDAHKSPLKWVLFFFFSSFISLWCAGWIWGRVQLLSSFLFLFIFISLANCSWWTRNQILCQMVSESKCTINEMKMILYSLYDLIVPPTHRIIWMYHKRFDYINLVKMVVVDTIIRFTNRLLYSAWTTTATKKLHKKKQNEIQREHSILFSSFFKIAQMMFIHAIIFILWTNKWYLCRVGSDRAERKFMEHIAYTFYQKCIIPFFFFSVGMNFTWT